MLYILTVQGLVSNIRVLYLHFWCGRMPLEQSAIAALPPGTWNPTLKIDEPNPRHIPVLHEP